MFGSPQNNWLGFYEIQALHARAASLEQRVERLETLGFTRSQEVALYNFTAKVWFAVISILLGFFTLVATVQAANAPTISSVNVPSVAHDLSLVESLSRSEVHSNIFAEPSSITQADNQIQSGASQFENGFISSSFIVF